MGRNRPFDRPHLKTIRFGETDLQPTDYKPVGWSIEKAAPIEGLPTSREEP